MRRVLDGFNKGFRIGGRLTNNLRHADDIILIATSQEDLQELVTRLKNEAMNYNMYLNASKTKTMSSHGDRISILVSGQMLE